MTGKFKVTMELTPKTTTLVRKKNLKKEMYGITHHYNLIS